MFFSQPQPSSPLQPAQRETKKAKFSRGKGPVAQWSERQSAGLKVVSSDRGGVSCPG